MIIALFFICLGLLILHIVNNLKIKRLVTAISNTNKSLNETRDLVAKHDKAVKKLSQN